MRHTPTMRTTLLGGLALLALSLGGCGHHHHSDDHDDHHHHLFKGEVEVVNGDAGADITAVKVNGAWTDAAASSGQTVSVEAEAGPADVTVLWSDGQRDDFSDVAVDGGETTTLSPRG